MIGRAIDNGVKSGLDRWVEAEQAKQAALDSLVARFDRDEHGPGEPVTGRIEAGLAIDCRSVAAKLGYAEESCEGFTAATVKAGPTPLHDGPLEGGESMPFEFRLPDRVLPPQTTEYGRAFWAVWVDLDRAKRKDVGVRGEIPVRFDPAWETFVPGERPETAPAEGEGSEWDVTTRVEPWSVRRGEEVTAELTIGEPSAERRDLSLALRCYVAYRWSSEGHAHTNRRDIWERVYLVDASLPHQTLRFPVPADAPFAYDGSVFSVQWRVTAREPRRMRRDLVRETAVQVRP